MNIPHQTIINIRYDAEVHERLPNGQVDAKVKYKKKGSILLTMTAKSEQRAKWQIDDFIKAIDNLYLDDVEPINENGEENE